ncbi:hypothetical protein [Salinilacihabitans rarus]|uniref:hypothetical protein n=1 Tax=Salinilacihabitans rarus TaxID=2961596 RepID=UPI0020C8A78F|nr:hypothetical protein [Salinilacihabitans rarus]
MKIDIPALPGIYYDTDAESTAVTVALTAAGRRAPKPQGYAVQLLPYLWGLQVDLREVPSDHPLQYLHPEGARSVQEFTRDRNASEVARDVDRAVRTLWEINAETERGVERLLGRPDRPAESGITIEIEEGSPEGHATMEYDEEADADVAGDEFRPDELGAEGGADDGNGDDR